MQRNPWVPLASEVGQCDVPRRFALADSLTVAGQWHRNT
jgi:hypothetical protein